MREYLKIIQEIRSTRTIFDIKRIMNGKIIPGTDNSKFEDEIYKFSIQNKIFNVKIELENDFLNIALRLMCFFKLGGKLGIKPLRRGKTEYIYKLSNILRDIEIVIPDIDNFENLTKTIFDKVIVNLNKNKNNFGEKNKYDKVRVLFEWAKYANKYIPSLFIIDIDIFYMSREYEQLVVKYFKTRNEDETNNIKRIPFDLNLTRVIMYNCIKYIEEYSEDGITATEYYLKSGEETEHNKKYRKAFYLLKNIDSLIKEPLLENLIYKCREHQTPNTYKTNLMNVKGLRQDLENISKKLEAACVIVILITTGMRQSELFALPRNPKVTYDENINLERIIFKTAITEDGESVDMPIPAITKKAIDILARISTLKDNSQEGSLLNGSLYSCNYKSSAKHDRIYGLIDFFCESFDLNEAPTPHQFRHIIAYLVSYNNKKDGLELARMLLGHKSISMTLHYLGHYNINFKEQVTEIQKEDSKLLVKSITLRIKRGEGAYGPKGKGISEEVRNYDFRGEIINEFTDLFEMTMNERIDRGEIVIIQTPVCLCIHDLTKEEEMACQRGFNISNYISEKPKPAYCEAYNCGNALFTETNVDNLNVGKIDEMLKKRLEKNKIFSDSGGFDNDPYRKIKADYLNRKV